MATYDSSGSFTVDSTRAQAVLAQAALEEELPLLLIRAAVKSKAKALNLQLTTAQVTVDLCLPEFDRHWQPLASGQWSRKITGSQLTRELKLILERARFCPIPLRLNGYISQPENTRVQPAKPDNLLNRAYHLAEHYTSREPDQPGLSLFCPDAHQKGPRANTPYTYWRDRPDDLEKLRWWMPWRVAGQVARLKSCPGLRCGSAALVLAQTGQAGRAIAVHQGIIVADLPFELPGVTLIFDASALAIDASGLQLVRSLELQDYLNQKRQDLSAWIQERLPRWQAARVTHRQNKKEIAAWLSVWGASLISGLAIFLPLPLLGLPWIVWHHTARKRIFERWQARLAELQRCERPGNSPGLPGEGDTERGQPRSDQGR